jgi:hypothetical protein
MRRLLLVGAVVLSVVATSALVWIGLSLRTIVDEERTQTACARSTALAVYQQALFPGTSAVPSGPSGPMNPNGHCIP